MLQSETIKKTKEAYHKVVEANNEMYQIFMDDIFLTWKWWLAFFLATTPWIIWFFIRKKESSDRLLYVGFFIIIITSWLDFIGVVCGLWFYSVDVIYFIPPQMLWNFSLIPVTVMLIIQYKPFIKPIKKALFFATGAVIVEFIFDILGFYEPLKWKLYYSFPVNFIIYLIAHYISRRDNFKNLETN